MSQSFMLIPQVASIQYLFNTISTILYLKYIVIYN